MIRHSFPHKILCALLSLILFVSALPAFALPEPVEPVLRTVMLYLVGSDLEGEFELATYNLTESMRTEENEYLQFIVLTGGSYFWYTDSEYLDGADSIDPELNQVWSLRGRRTDEEHGIMTLLEPDGLPGCENQSLSDPASLTAFVDYCFEHYSADAYDLILWDHGGGPAEGFCFDERFFTVMSFSQIVGALQSTRLIGSGEVFELVDFDACLMGSAEIITALSPYADYLVLSAETEPGYGQDYFSWLETLRQDPGMTGFEIGRAMVDGFVDFYNREQDYGTLAVIDTANFRQRLLPALIDLDAILAGEAMDRSSVNGRYNFYDELYAMEDSIGYAMNEYSLYDLGNLAGALSVPRTEFDVLSDDDIRWDRNVYTDVCLRILDAMGDRDGSGDDVLYAGFSDSTCKVIRDATVRGPDKAILVQDEDGLVTIRPTGISLFLGDSSSKNAMVFVEELEKVADLLPDGPQKTYLTGRTTPAALYAMIRNLGSIISMLAGFGQYDPDFETIRKDLNDLSIWSRFDSLIGHLVSEGVFASVEQAETYLGQIASQQCGEVLHKDRITVTKREPDHSGVDKYKVTIDGVSVQSIAAVGSSMQLFVSMDIPELIDALPSYYRNIPLETLFPTGIRFAAGEAEGAADMTEFIDYQHDVQFDLMRDFYASDRISWTVPNAQRTCYALIDASGGAHAASVVFDDASKSTGYVAILIRTATQKYLTGYLVVAKDEGRLKIQGLTVDKDDISPRTFIPMNSETFRNCTFAPAVQTRENRYYMAVTVPVSTFAEAETDLTNWGIRIEERPVEDVPDIIAVQDLFFVDDVYSTGTHNDVTDRFSEAEERATQGDLIRCLDDAEISVERITYNGGFQKPDVTVRLTLYLCRIQDGTPTALEHSAVAWVPPENVGGFALCPADRELWKQCRSLVIHHEIQG